MKEKLHLNLSHTYIVNEVTHSNTLQKVMWKMVRKHIMEDLGIVAAIVQYAGTVELCDV